MIQIEPAKGELVCAQPVAFLKLILDRGVVRRVLQDLGRETIHVFEEVFPQNSHGGHHTDFGLDSFVWDT